MSGRVVALLAGAALSILGAAGCGGAADAPPLSKAEFVKRADAACTQRVEEARAKFLAYGESVTKPQESPAERQAHLATVAQTIIVPELREQVADVRSLGAPKGDEQAVEAILGAIENGIPKAVAHPKRAIEESANLFEPAARLAKAYGLRVCGTG